MSVRRVGDLGHDELAVLVSEYLLAGHLIDRAGMPTVIGHGVDVMAAIAIDEWMGASPIYTKRIQRMLGFEGDTVEACFKAMQLDIGAPLGFMDFRFTVDDDHHGRFHLDHCGALMDVEPMGDEFVRAMCHDIEDPTFDATAWATNPRMRMRPVHRPPRVPADRHPHCAWTVEIDETAEPTPEPPPLARIAATNAANVPLPVLAAARAAADGVAADGMVDYSGPLDADLRIAHFAPDTLRALAGEIALQGHLLSMSFLAAVEDRFGTEAAVEAGAFQFTGVAGVTARRLRKAFDLGDGADAVATVFALHPAFAPSDYVTWSVEVDGDTVRLELGDCPARHEEGIESWIGLLADGHDRPIAAIAAGVDARLTVRSDGPCRWIAERGPEPLPEMSEVAVTLFSTGAEFELPA